LGGRAVLGRNKDTMIKLMITVVAVLSFTVTVIVRVKRR
jgi:hypothetical protein